MKLTKAKKAVASVAISLLAFLGVTGCNGNESSKKDGTTVVCTIFPVYDWVCEMTEGCDDVNVVLLAKNGADMHSFQPTVKDFVTIADCDMFIYVGGESEEWIDDCLSQNPNESRTDVNLTDILEGKLLEESDDNISQTEEEEEEEPENDEHIWLSIQRSVTCIEAIAPLLADKISDSEKILENASVYANELEILDNEYREFFSTISNPEMIIVDRFPFRYFVSDYGIEYYAAFSGCSAETEASFETIKKLSEALSESNQNVVYITESGDEKLAKTVMEEAGKEVDVAHINSIQSVGQNEIDSGEASYISYMTSNLDILKQYMNQ